MNVFSYKDFLAEQDGSGFDYLKAEAEIEDLKSKGASIPDCIPSNAREWHTLITQLDSLYAGVKPDNYQYKKSAFEIIADVFGTSGDKNIAKVLRDAGFPKISELAPVMLTIELPLQALEPVFMQWDIELSKKPLPAHDSGFSYCVCYLMTGMPDSFYALPEKLDNLVTMNEFQQEFNRFNYLMNNNKQQEVDDFLDWVADCPPTFEKKSKALWDKERIISEVTRLSAAISI